MRYKIFPMSLLFLFLSSCMSLSYSTNNGIDYTLAKDENLGDFILTQIKMNEYSKYENAPTGEIYKKKLLNMKMKSRNS